VQPVELAGAPVTSTPPLPRRDAYTPPDWWQPYTAQFPRWRAWQGSSQFWARLPGTMRVCHANDPAELADHVRIADTNTFADHGHRERPPK
jgi:hypothetical protein